MTRRIAFINEKGGTGKTTLAVHTAAWLATETGASVLLVDLDTQGHVGKSLGIDVRESKVTTAEVLTGEARAADALVATGVAGLEVIPANRRSATLPETLAGRPDRHRVLRQSVDTLADDYDYVVFDAPPSLGLVTQNVLLAADEIVVPVAATYLALDGCAEVVRTVESIRTEHGHRALRISLVIPTFWRRTNLASEIVERLENYFPERVGPKVGYNVKIDEAQSHGQTVWEYAPWSRGAQMLEAVATRVRDAG